MYLVLFGPSMVCAVVGAVAAAALVYEYYVSKQTERKSSVEHRVYSTLQSESIVKDSANRIDLRRRKHRTEVNRKTTNENSENLLNSNINVMKAEKHLTCDNKVLGDVIRNSECNEKRYEKDVFNKVKNNLNNLNQNFEEKEFSGKNIDDSSCVNCVHKTTETSNLVKNNPLVTFGETQQKHDICNKVSFSGPLENLKSVTTYSDRQHDECEIKKSNNFRPKCSDEIVNYSENHQSPITVIGNVCKACSDRQHDECEIKKSNLFLLNCSDEIVNNSENHQSPKTVIDNDREAKSCIHIKRNALYINSSQKFDKQQLNVIGVSNKHLCSACEKVFKNNDIHLHDRKKIYCKDSKWKEAKVLNNSCYENSYSSSVVDNENFTGHKSVKCNFDNIHEENANTELHSDMLNNHFVKQEVNIKFPNQAQQINLLNSDSSYAHSVSARLEVENANHSKLQNFLVTSPTEGINEYIHQRENIFHCSVPGTSSSACNDEICTGVSERRKLYDQYKHRIHKNTTSKEESKILCVDASSQKYISSSKPEKISLNSDCQPQLSFNTVTETSKHINYKKYSSEDTKLNLIARNSKHIENMLNSSIYTIKQHAAVNFTKFPGSPSYFRTTKSKFSVPGKENNIEIFGYNQVNSESKFFDISSLSIISHLRHKFMPGLQSYVSSIRNFVKEHKEMALYVQTNDSNSENASNTENYAEVTEAVNVDIGIQIGSTFGNENEELNNPTSELHSALCKGCMEVLANTVSIPCGHSYFCKQCAEITSKIYKKCCICHNHVTSFKQMTI